MLFDFAGKNDGNSAGASVDFKMLWQGRFPLSKQVYVNSVIVFISATLKEKIRGAQPRLDDIEVIRLIPLIVLPPFSEPKP